MNAATGLQRRTTGISDRELKLFRELPARSRRNNRLDDGIAWRRQEPSKGNAHGGISEFKLRPSDECRAAIDLESWHGVCGG